MNEELIKIKEDAGEHRWKMYARGAALLACISLMYALWAHYTARKVSDDLIGFKRGNDSLSYQVKTLRNQNGALVTDKIALTAQSDGMLKDMSTQIFKLKTNQERLVTTVTNLTMVKQRIRVDTVFIGYDTSKAVPLIGKGRSDSTAVPQFFSKEDTNGAIYGRVLKKGVAIDSQFVYNELSLRFGTRKKGFLHLGREDFAQGINSNPNVRTEGMAYYNYKPRVSAWNRVIKPALVAVLVAAAFVFIKK